MSVVSVAWCVCVLGVDWVLVDCCVAMGRCVLRIGCCLVLMCVLRVGCLLAWLIVVWCVMSVCCVADV